MESFRNFIYIKRKRYLDTLRIIKDKNLIMVAIGVTAVKNTCF